MRFSRAAFFLCCSFLLFCLGWLGTRPVGETGGAEAPVHRPISVESPPRDAGEGWVDSVLTGLTLDEKIGQLLIINLAPEHVRGVDDAAEAVQRYHVGGFLVPRLMEPEAVLEETNRLQRLARVPLFFAADYERGAGRFNNNLTELPSNMALGATRDPDLARAAGAVSAQESRAMGVNLLFAPVVDVNNNPDNPIINTRSYGEDPELVGRMATAYVEGAQAHGSLVTLKHFPGHGNTALDSHSSMGKVPGSRAALDSVELRPYRMAFALPTPPAAVMTAHLWVPALEADPLPATLSRRVLTGVLREHLGFDGLVITDDIGMGALSKRYAYEQRVVGSLAAGADIILTPVDPARAVAAIRKAVAEKTLTPAEIDRAVRRVLHAKRQAGLHQARQTRNADLAARLGAPQNKDLAQQIADQGLTLLKSDAHLPLRRKDVALVQMTNHQHAESIRAAMKRFAGALDEAPSVEIENFRLVGDPDKAQSGRVLAAVDRADVVVLGLYLRIRVGRGNVDLDPGQAQLARAILETGKPVVLVTFGNPYVVTGFAKAAALLVAYDQTLETVNAAAGILTGALPPRGRLPITVGPYPFGSGLTLLNG